MPDKSIPLLLFAKAPIAGKVKTRLTSHCSDQQAADIAEILLEESIRRVCEFWPGAVYLSIWLDEQHPFIQTMLKRYSIRLTKQCVGDLGQKMQHAVETHGYPGAVMGCDAPHISGTTLLSAYQLLTDGQSCIAPSHDGGYYFIGLHEAAPELFSGPQWGSDTVMHTTRQNAARHAIDLHELPSLNDVDEWDDLLIAAKLLPSLARYLRQENLL